MSDRADVLALVLHWGDPALTERSVRSLVRQAPPLDVLVVANGQEWERPADLGVEVLRRPTNGGYAGGMNSGLARALSQRYPYALLATNDAWFDAMDAVGRLRGLLEDHPVAAACGPALYRRTQTGTPELWALGGDIDWSSATASLRRPTSLASPPVQADWLGGSMLLLRTDAVRSIGPFDERFFMYWEEVDWCVRARRAGWTLIVEPDVRCLEDASASAGSIHGLRSYFMTRNRMLLFEKHRAWRAVAVALTGSARQAFGRARASGAWRPVAWGVADYVTRRFGPRRGFGDP